MSTIVPVRAKGDGEAAGAGSGSGVFSIASKSSNHESVSSALAPSLAVASCVLPTVALFLPPRTTAGFGAVAAAGVREAGAAVTAGLEDARMGCAEAGDAGEAAEAVSSSMRARYCAAAADV